MLKYIIADIVRTFPVLIFVLIFMIVLYKLLGPYMAMAANFSDPFG